MQRYAQKVINSEDSWQGWGDESVEERSEVNGREGANDTV